MTLTFLFVNPAEHLLYISLYHVFQKKLLHSKHLTQYIKEAIWDIHGLKNLEKIGQVVFKVFLHYSR